MGLFGSLLGWDQSMAAINAVMASYLIEKADSATRQMIVDEVIRIIAGVHRHKTPDEICQDVSKEPRVVQMNFIALACDNLAISPPFSRCEWTRVKNPYQTMYQVDENYIAAAVDAIRKDDFVQVIWPGNDARIDFMKLRQRGA